MRPSTAVETFRSVSSALLIGLAAGGSAHAADVTLTGADLLGNPRVQFPTQSPTLSGTSLVFGTYTFIPGQSRHAKLVVLPLDEFGLGIGTYPSVIEFSVNLTRLPCQASGGLSCATADERDWDPFVLLSDGAQMLGASIGDNLDGNSGAQDAADLGSVGVVDESLSTVIFQSAGFPGLGEAVDVHYLFNLGSGSTGMGVSFNNSTGSFVFPKSLSLSSGVGLVLMRDNELGEQYQLNSITLHIPPLAIIIDIKPGSFPNSINLKSNGVVPVAILSSQDFNPVGVVVDTVKFAGASPEKFHYEDVNSDGVADLILHFRTQQLVELTSGSIAATLTGELADGGSITGTDSVRIVPPGHAGKE